MKRVITTYDGLGRIPVGAVLVKEDYRHLMMEGTDRVDGMQVHPLTVSLTDASAEMLRGNAGPWTITGSAGDYVEIEPLTV